MASRTRPGMHYGRRTNGEQAPTRHALTDRDRAYRAALGLGDDDPLPKRYGSGR